VLHERSPATTRTGARATAWRRSPSDRREGRPLTPFPTEVHELVVAPAVFAIAFHHARKALGAARAAAELGVLVLYGFVLEALTMRVFGSHRYDSSWHLAPLGVPVAVALVWAAVILSALTLAARRGVRPAEGRAVGAALVAVTLDLMIEPVAVRAGRWEWTPPGVWLGVPIGNFVGWIVIVGVYAVAAERWGGAGSPAREILRRARAAAIALGCLVAVGLFWTRAGLERPAGAVGWWVWGALVLLTMGVGGRSAPPYEGPTLAGRLAAAPGPAPGLVLLLVATLFAADAALVADRTIGLAVLGPVAALLVSLRPTGSP
jgi:hypothetical protein